MEAGEGKAAVEAQTQRWLDALDKWYDTGMQVSGCGRVAFASALDTLACAASLCT